MVRRMLWGGEGEGEGVELVGMVWEAVAVMASALFHSGRRKD